MTDESFLKSCNQLIKNQRILFHTTFRLQLGKLKTGSSPNSISQYPHSELLYQFQFAALYLTHNPFFLTLYRGCMGAEPCQWHLSWSCTCICNTWMPWRGAMSSTCSPPSPDTSDCRPPSFAHVHELLIPPFQLFGHFCEDSESICLDLNNLHYENL